MIAGEARAGTSGADAAAKIGAALQKELCPDSISVTVAESGKLWAECSGALISEIKIKKIKLDASIDLAALEAAETGDEIMNCVEDARGEITLTEKDINRYFESRDGDAGGFSGLSFDFTPEGYKAKGRFSLELLGLPLGLDIEAEGVLGLKEDGVYLEDTVIYTEGSRQSETVTELITDRVNPLLSFRDIPFWNESGDTEMFCDIKMTNSEVTLSGNPQKAGEGESWNWRK